MGTKPADKFSLPLCYDCHINRQHRIGELAFYSALGIEPVDVALRLWTISGDDEAGQRIIFRAQQRIALAHHELPGPSGE